MSSNEPALMQIAERILKASQEKERAEEAIKMIYDEARSVGYEPKILRRAINILKMDESERKKYRAEEEVLGLYIRQMDLFK